LKFQWDSPTGATNTHEVGKNGDIRHIFCYLLEKIPRLVGWSLTALSTQFMEKIQDKDSHCVTIKR